MEYVNIIENVSDLSYAWETLGDYLDVFHERIRKDPSSVVLLRATFLKTASILDVPMIRISEIDSPDAVSTVWMMMMIMMIMIMIMMMVMMMMMMMIY